MAFFARGGLLPIADPMSSSHLIRWSGLASVLGGISIALFMILHPWGQFVGADVARTAAWRIAHSLHFVGATFALLGLVGLYARQAERFGPLGLVGFVAAFIGTAMFVGTGMITAFVWPMLAVQAPATVEIGGAMFSPPALTALKWTAILVILGYVSFGIATLRARILPRSGTVLLIVGAVLGMIPPQPLGPNPWIGLVLGGVLFGAGSVRLGYALWKESR